MLVRQATTAKLSTPPLEKPKIYRSLATPQAIVGVFILALLNFAGQKTIIQTKTLTQVSIFNWSDR